MCCVHSRSARSYSEALNRRRVLRSLRHVLSPSSHTGASDGVAGPGKKASLGGAGSVRVKTPVCETRSCRGFHSSAKEKSESREKATSEMRALLKEKSLFMNGPKKLNQ